MADRFRLLVVGGSETSLRLRTGLLPDAQRIWRLERALRGRIDGGWLHWLMTILEARRQGRSVPAELPPWPHGDDPWNPHRVYRWPGGVAVECIAHPDLTADAADALLRFAAPRLSATPPDLVVISIGSGDLAGTPCRLLGADLDPDDCAAEVEPRNNYNFSAHPREKDLRPAVNRVAARIRQLFPRARRVFLGPLRSPATTPGGASNLLAAQQLIAAAAQAHGAHHLPLVELPGGAGFHPDGYPTSLLQRRIATALAALLPPLPAPRTEAAAEPSAHRPPAARHQGQPGSPPPGAAPSAPPARRRVCRLLPGARPARGRFRLLVIGASESNRRRTLDAPLPVHQEWARELAARYELPGMWPLRLMRALEEQLDPNWRPPAAESAVWGAENLYQRSCSFIWNQAELWNIAAPRMSVAAAASMVAMHASAIAQYAPHAVILCLGRTDLVEQPGLLYGIDLLETGPIPEIAPWSVYRVPPRTEPEPFRKELGQVVRTLRRCVPGGRLILMDLLPMAALSRRQAERFTAFNKAIAAVAATTGAGREDYAFLPPPADFDWRLWLHDDHHPNDRFNQAIATSLAERLAPVVATV